MNIDKFLTDGFLLYENALTPELLHKWRVIADQIESEALEAHFQGERLPHACVVEDAVGPRLMRQDQLFVSHLDELIELLSIEPMLEIMKYLSGPSSVVVYSDLLYKHQHPHPVIKWHQGAPHSRNYPYLNIGIYLDDSDENDGCLRYVPGTQFELQNIAEVEGKYGWNPPEVVQQPVKAGDILVQDMMILHSSEPKRSPGARRTIYVEVRPYEAISEDQEPTQEWLISRKVLTSKILNHSDQSIYSEAEKELFNEPQLTNVELIEKIETSHLAPIPAVYNNLDAQGPDYPVPGDLV